MRISLAGADGELTHVTTAAFPAMVAGWPSRCGGLVGALVGLGRPGLALACPSVLDGDDGQPEQLGDGVVGGEVAAGPADLAEW